MIQHFAHAVAFTNMSGQGENGSAPGSSTSNPSDAYIALQAGSQPFFRPAETADLDAILKLELESYPPDEAATREKLELRLQQAPGAFIVAVAPGQEDPPDGSGDRIVGFVCGTCAHGPRLTHASMSHHELDGPVLCIHSVVVAAELRRRGLATRMLKAYLVFVQAAMPQVRSAALLCKSDLVKLYERAGFSLLGPSDVVHGQDLWYEMQQPLQVEA